MASFQMRTEEVDFIGYDKDFIPTGLPNVFVNTQTEEVAVITDDATYIISTTT